ncbi:single-stranded DNA-binding protein [Neobacillus sp. NRS-1170]|uniref:single-stranded DNA-binding protein n=1 Tax=Neobacillus sp. NRS-1170 TaxID=3233898 RepID=UPI003D29171E
MNTVNLIGRLVKDGELKFAQSGTAFYLNTLAVNRKFKKEETDYIRLLAFTKTAEIMGNNLIKGDQIGIEGHIQTGSYEKDGQKTFTTQVVVDSITFVGKRKENESQIKTAVSNEPLQTGTVIDDEDLPF